MLGVRYRVRYIINEFLLDPPYYPDHIAIAPAADTRVAAASWPLFTCNCPGAGFQFGRRLLGHLEVNAR